MALNMEYRNERERIDSEQELRRFFKREMRSRFRPDRTIYWGHPITEEKKPNPLDRLKELTSAQFQELLHSADVIDLRHRFEQSYSDMDGANIRAALLRELADAIMRATIKILVKSLVENIVEKFKDGITEEQLRSFGLIGEVREYSPPPEITLTPENLNEFR